MAQGLGETVQREQRRGGVVDPQEGSSRRGQRSALQGEGLRGAQGQMEGEGRPPAPCKPSPFSAPSAPRDPTTDLPPAPGPWLEGKGLQVHWAGPTLPFPQLSPVASALAPCDPTQRTVVPQTFGLTPGM